VRAGDILVGKDHAEGREPDDAGREASARHFRRKGVRRRDTSLACLRACREPSSKSASSTATASTRTSAPWRSNGKEIERLAKDRDDEQAILDRNVYSRLAELLENRQGIAGPKGFKKGHQDHACGAR